MTTRSDNYSFPFKPYSIQTNLMDHLYKTISSSSITVIESPTGTGKSLSLACASLSWLIDFKLKAKDNLMEEIKQEWELNNIDEPDWVLEQEIERRVKELEREETELNSRLEAIRVREQREKANGSRKKMKFSNLNKVQMEVDLDDEFAPDEYDESSKEVINDNYSPEVRELMKKSGGLSSNKEELLVDPVVQKIFYASRTHSQLSQFISELRKTSFTQPNPSSTQSSSSKNPSPQQPIRVIPLGSRQQLCINDSIIKKSGGSTEALGELCLELQKGGKKTRCEFLPSLDEGPSRMNEFRDEALSKVRDIEDIEDLGRKTKCCPYYGSRKAVNSAEVVTLPYNMLMQASSRAALGIDLKDQIVIIDEAHNIISTLLSINSITITTTMLLSLQKALFTYFTKFKSRLKGSNAVYLKQLILVFKSLREFGQNWGSKKEMEVMITVNELVKSMKGSFDQINLLKLDDYLKNSQIARKIGGYLDSVAEESTPKGRQALKSNATRNLHQIQSFLVALTNSNKDGRIILSSEKVLTAASSTSTTLPNVKAGTVTLSAAKEEIVVSFRYLLLNPTEVFRPVVEEARAIILAGGTMTPLSDFKEQLFPYHSKFSTFSCDHIVPKENVKTFAIQSGPKGIKFEFIYQNRGKSEMLDDLGEGIINICDIVEKGVVVFVPSYAFLDSLIERWVKIGILKRLGAKKKIFLEPKTTSEVENVLKDYTGSNSDSSHGACLFAVVGAKLSEGINFSDDLARAVIICGIPYPNSNSTELKERMNYLKNSSKTTTGPDAGQILYSNLAFRAVNQSIGRAIRHQNDWSSIILLDTRYAASSAQKKLPNWLGREVVAPKNFIEFIKELDEFCKARRA